MIQYHTFLVPSVNVTVQGRMYYNDQSPIKKNVIISHGFGSSMKASLNLVQPLTKIGCRVYLFNFKPFQEDTDDTSVLTEKANLESVVKFVRKTSHLRTLDLVGCSQGGLVSALVANDHPRTINRLALFYPAFSIPHDMRTHQRSSLNGIRFNKKYIKDAQSLDPWKQIRRFRRPVLICHGNRDQLVPIGFAEKAHSTYKNSKFVTIKNGDHGFHQGLRVALTALVNFIKM